MEIVELAVAIILAAMVAEGVIEFVVSPLLDYFVPKTENNKNSALRTVIMNALSAVLGVGIALNFHLGLFYFLRFTGNPNILDEALTGVLLGRGSNYIHTFVKKFVTEAEWLEEIRKEPSD